MTKNIEKIIVKYLTNSATAEDLDKLSIWIETPENKLIFKDFAQTHFAINYSLNDSDTQLTIEFLLNGIRKEKSLVYRIRNKAIYKYAAAASVLLVVALTVFLNKTQNNSEIVEPVIVNTNTIEPGTDKATLTLGDGSVVVLEKGNTFQSQNVSSNGEDIIYEADKSQSHDIVYNYLTIPRGGQFYIVLADGTKVWLNSESQLKYPISFIEGETRKVELVYGEAYFDVSPSVENQGSKFMVINQSQEIEVLGTEFNVKAYKDEVDIVTTLVEGKVTVNTSGKINTLKPSEQSLFNVNTQKITVNKVDNLLDAIAWKDDYFSFQKKSMKDIMKVLSRWYDVDYTFKNPEKENKTFTGILDRAGTIQEILLNIQKTNEMNFTIDQKTIIIE